MLSEDKMRRLAFIRFLYGLGVEQSRRPEPLAAASILTFHDSVELFLQLAAEHLNVGKKRVEFEEYWALIEPELKGTRLAERESMRRLNKLRVNLKHDGAFPSLLSIEGFRGSVTTFFEVNTPIVFGIDFSGISMVNLVTCQEARDSLKKAEALAQENELKDALLKVSAAFRQLLHEYERHFDDGYGQSPFYFGKALKYPAAVPIAPDGRDPTQCLTFMDFLHKMVAAVDGMQSAIRVVTLGLDYHRYNRFRLLAPDTTTEAGRDAAMLVVKRWDKEPPTAEEYRFCFDFVIDSALRLQEYDFGTPTP